MKVKVILILALIILLCGPVLFSQKDPHTLVFKDIEFKPINPGFEQIREGLSVYYVEDTEIPAVSVYVIIKNGTFNDPEGKTGLAALTVRLMKSGGTQSLTPEEMEEKLDFLGSFIGAFADDEYCWFSLWTLKKNFDASWALFTDMIFHPRFDEKRLEIEKLKELESIRRRWDQPMGAGFTLFSELLYGKDYPETRRTTSKGIESITAADVDGFYKNFIKDRELIAAVSGDFEKDKILNLVKESFSGWQGVPAVTPEIPPAKLAAAPGVYVIDKEDMTQAVVCVGHLGINRLDPDNAEISVLNFIYGSGGFNSRITREIRSNRGLAYAAFGAITQGRDKGAFWNFCMTKNESVNEAVTIIRDTMKGITTDLVTADELKLAKDYEKNSMIHNFDSSDSILLRKVTNKIQGYPDDYLETYLGRVEKVDAPKVLEMAKRTIHPDQVVILVVGKKAELMDQLKALNLGEIKEITLEKE